MTDRAGVEQLSEPVGGEPRLDVDFDAVEDPRLAARSAVWTTLCRAYESEMVPEFDGAVVEHAFFDVFLAPGCLTADEQDDLDD